MKVVFFGTSEFALPILEKLAASEYRPTCVVTTPDAPAGRGRKLTPPPVKLAAGRLGIPVIQPQNLKIENCLPAEASLARRSLGEAGAQAGKLEIGDCDLFIVAAYGKIIPGELLKIPKFCALNVHPSLLPRWRGASPIPHAILAGDAETGVTIILMDEEADHGPMLKFKYLNIESRKWTTPELTDALAKMGAELLLETIPGWLRGAIAPVAQDDSQASYAKRLTREDGHIDWKRPAATIEAMIRALQPWPGGYTFWNRDGNRLRLAIERGEVDPTLANDLAQPFGTVFGANGGFGVATGEGLLFIKRLKLEGGASMDAAEFLRGHRDILGVILF